MVTEQTFRLVLTDWLALTRDVDLPTGLDRGTALARARLLRRRVLAGSTIPEELEINEEAKDVLYALVELLKSDPAAGPDPLREPNAIYQFIRLVAWSDDELQERRGLLRSCAEIGLATGGLSVAEISRRRVFPTPTITRPEEDWFEDLHSRPVSNPEVFQAALIKLTELRNTKAPFVTKHAAALYSLLTREKDWGRFDERDHFLGEAALLAAGGHRIMGSRQETEAWLQRATVSFGQVLSPQPFLARCMYVRLALEYDKHRLKLVLESIPSLLTNFEKFDMRSDLAKTRLMEAMTLKETSRKQEAFQKFDALRQGLDEADAGLLGFVHVALGELLSLEGRYAEGLASYQKAQDLLSSARWGVGLANLKLCVGESLQFQGRLSSAVQAYREAVAAYAEAGIATQAAYCRVVLAGALVELGRHEEAESEILTALPTIEKQEMVPQGVAAVALLRESIRARATDPDALRELREHLKGRT